MQSRVLLWYLLGGVGILGATTGCGVSVEPVTSGQLCAPDRDGCPNRSRVERPPPGVNRLDIVLIQEGTGRPRVTLEVRDADTSFAPEDTGVDAASSEEDTTRGAPGSESPDAGSAGRVDGPLARRTYRPGEEERITDRLVPTELPEADALDLRLSCIASEEATCRIRLEYVFLTERPECKSDSECRGDRLCDSQLGRCVECRNDDQCEPDQSCNANNGRCIPKRSGGCHLSGTSSPLPVWLVGVLIVGLAYRRFRGREHRDARWLALSILVGLLVWPTRGRADPPDASIVLETGPRWVLGDLGNQTRRGLGMRLRQGIRTTYLGGEAWVETHYFLTDQTPPPLTRELQIYAFGLGPRAYIPIWELELTIGAGYQRVGLAPNSLIRRTPERGQRGTNAHALGGRVGMTYRWNMLRVGVHTSMYTMFDVPGSWLALDLSIGLSTH